MSESLPIGVVIADTSFIVRKGIQSLIDENPPLKFIAEVADSKKLVEVIDTKNPRVLIVDHCCDDCFSIDFIAEIKNNYPELQILVISHEATIDEIKKVLRIGIKNFLLKDCNEHELISAIKACAKGEKFFCQEIVTVLIDHNTSLEKCYADGLTERENEIISLLVVGNRPKEIADKLSISPLTVNTHKKNIYRKLRINHSIELAQYAYKSGMIK